MKLCTCLLLCSVMSISANVRGQHAKMSLDLKSVTLEEVIWALEKKSDITFFYNVTDMEGIDKMNAVFKDVPLENILNEVLKGTGLYYEIQGKVVVIKRNLSLFVADSLKSITIKGIVTDNRGEALPGVSIILKGMQTGVATGIKGDFSLNISKRDSVVLVFSFVGMKTKEVKWTGQALLKVALEEDINEIGEIVITGYQQLDRRKSTSATNSFGIEEIKIPGVTNLTQMLEGKIPDMVVLSNSGEINATPRLRIRGTSTIIGNREPLWVVDGVIQSDPLPIPDDANPLSSEMDGLRETASNAISWLNPADIETITVLKDASATAIYGTKATNGVIVITTKKAKGDGLNISYSGNFNVGMKPAYRMYDMMNSQEHMRFSQQLWEDRDSYNQNILPIGYAGLIQKLQKKEITRQQFEQEYRKMENMNTDWFDILFRNSFSHAHNVSISAQGEKVASRFSVGINSTRGEAKGNSMTTLTANSNTTFRLDKRLIIDLQLNGSYRETEDFAFGVSPYEYAMNTARDIPAYHEDGTLYYHEKVGATSYSIPNKYSYNYNIINERDNSGTETDGTNLQAALNLRLNLLEDLEFQTTASYAVATNKIKSWATENTHYITKIRGYEVGEILPNSAEQNASVLPFGGLLQSEYAQTKNYSFRSSLVYNKMFNEDHRLTLNLGFQVNSVTQEGNASLRYGYLYYRGEKFATVPKEITAANGLHKNSRDLHDEMRAGTTVTTTKNNTVSEYFTAVYGYKERYIMNFNARLDASNRFGQDENKKFNPSLSIGVKWRIGNEPFMAWASSWYDMFDISFSYGWRGNAVEAVSPYLIAKDGGLNKYFQQYTLKMVSLPYPDLGWEKTEDWNLGVDFSFFQGRMSAGLSWYNKISHVLASREVPIENGVANAYVDGTTMKNSGYELAVSVTPVRTKDFTWSLSFNTSKVKNTIRNNQRENTRDDYFNGTAIVSGEKYGTFYGFAFNGLDATNGRPTFKNMDIDITENDLDYLVKIGCLEPDISGGLNTSLRYKRLHLRASFAMSFGAQTFLPDFFATAGAPRPEQNAPRYLFKRWRKPGDEKITNIPSIPAGNPNEMSIQLPVEGYVAMSPYAMYNQSDLRVADTDFIRCRQISLQYDLPDAWVNKIGVRRASVNASLSNPFFIAFDKAWEGRDPETANWPARRTVSCSLTLNF